MMSDLRMAVVGVGRMGLTHAENLQSRIRGARLVAVTTSSAARADEARRRCGAVSVHDDLEGLLEAETLDAVVIASSTSAHVANVEDCAAAGLHILCEKPLGLSLDDCDRAAEAARAAGVKEGESVLDVGCGNGYYALRMADAGAAAVLGIDPTQLYVMQFLAVTTHLPPQPVAVLPLRLDELPEACHAFDTTFSMGVLYHQRSPLEHLRQLRATLRRGGQLVLETIFIPGDESYACTPPDRSSDAAGSEA